MFLSTCRSPRAARLTIALLLGLVLALATGVSAAGAGPTLPCNLTQWTGTNLDSFPVYKVSNPDESFDPLLLPGDGPMTASIVGSSMTVNLEETFAGPVTETSNIGIAPATRYATVTVQTELTGQLAQIKPTPAGGSFTATISGKTALDATGFTYSGMPIASTGERTVPVTGTVNCAAGQLRLSSKLFFVYHTITLSGPGSAPEIAPLPPATAQTFEGSQYQSTVLDQPLRLYRRYGGGSSKLGKYWSRTNFTSANDAKQDLALPPGNPATSRVVIEVPKGTEIYWGKAAPQPQWSEPGGGDQVAFPPKLRIPARWIKRSSTSTMASASSAHHRRHRQHVHRRHRAKSVLLTGLGATQQAWDAHHQPDPTYPNSFGPMPEGTYPGAVDNDQFADVTFDERGRLDGFLQKFTPGTTQTAASAAVGALLPPDATKVAGPVEPGSESKCVAEEFVSQSLGAQDGGRKGITVTFQSYYSLIPSAYTSQDVREAFVNVVPEVIPAGQFGKGTLGALICG